MRSTRASELLAAMILAGSLLVGCAPALPVAVGLGGSDGEIVDGSDESDGGVRGGSDDELLTGSHGIGADIYVNPAWQGTGRSLRFERLDSNCVRGEISGTRDLAFFPSTPVSLMDSYDGGAQCPTQTSWATWRITLTLANGSSGSTKLEVKQTNTPGRGTFSMQSLCWHEGNLACDGGTASALPNGQIAIYVGLVAIGPPGSNACAVDSETCTVSGTHDVAFGLNGSYAIRKNVSGSVLCDLSSFDRDPAPGYFKGCFIL